MSLIFESYKQAELALAAYSNLTSNMTNAAYKLALRDGGKGMSEAQATAFAGKYTVVTQFNHFTGASATVFQEIATGKRYLAIRGTQGITDFIDDYFILNTTPSQLNPQYLALKAQMQVWLADPAILQGQSFTVTGHSLGGYLAAGLSADFAANISHAYLYNSPGNNSLISTVLQNMGILASSDPAKITNLRADAGISPISALGNAFSTPIQKINGVRLD